MYRLNNDSEMTNFAAARDDIATGVARRAAIRDLNYNHNLNGFIPAMLALASGKSIKPSKNEDRRTINNNPIAGFVLKGLLRMFAVNEELQFRNHRDMFNKDASRPTSWAEIRRLGCGCTYGGEFSREQVKASLAKLEDAGYIIRDSPYLPGLGKSLLTLTLCASNIVRDLEAVIAARKIEGYVAPLNPAQKAAIAAERLARKPAKKTAKKRTQKTSKTSTKQTVSEVVLQRGVQPPPILSIKEQVSSSAGKSAGQQCEEEEVSLRGGNRVPKEPVFSSLKTTTTPEQEEAARKQQETATEQRALSEGTPELREAAQLLHKEFPECPWSFRLNSLLKRRMTNGQLSGRISLPKLKQCIAKRSKISPDSPLYCATPEEVLTRWPRLLEDLLSDKYSDILNATNAQQAVASLSQPFASLKTRFEETCNLILHNQFDPQFGEYSPSVRSYTYRLLLASEAYNQLGMHAAAAAFTKTYSPLVRKAAFENPSHTLWMKDLCPQSFAALNLTQFEIAAIRGQVYSAYAEASSLCAAAAMSGLDMRGIRLP